MHPIPHDVSSAPTAGGEASQPPHAQGAAGAIGLLPAYLLGLLTALLLVGGTILVTRRPEPAPIVLHPPPTPVATPTALPTATPAPLIVFVSGAVQTSGLFVLPPGSRVGDALEAAGGLEGDADPALVNQALLLWDGAQVHVPRNGEPRAAGPPVGLSGQASSPALAAAGSGRQNMRINVNTATAAELETLPGIGAARAQAIIEHRPYATLQDLERVPGIGVKTLENLAEWVEVP